MVDWRVTAQIEAFHDLAETPGVEIKAKHKPASPMHLKSSQIDGRLLRTGAANFSASSLKRQDNDLIVIESAEAAAAFKRAFYARYARCRLALSSRLMRVPGGLTMVSHTSAPRQNRRIRNGNAQGTAITRLVPVAFQQVIPAWTSLLGAWNILRRLTFRPRFITQA